MEKFGIFELLDTLSAILGEGSDTSEAAKPQSAPSVTDVSFLPPDYTGGAAEGGGAISSFLNKHDETVKRIGKKKE